MKSPNRSGLYRNSSNPAASTDARNARDAGSIGDGEDTTVDRPEPNPFSPLSSSSTGPPMKRLPRQPPSTQSPHSPPPPHRLHSSGEAATRSQAASDLVADSLETARIAAEAAGLAAEAVSPNVNAALTTDRLEHVSQRLTEIHLALERLRVSIETLTQNNSDHEERLRRLERWQQRMNPVLGLITFLLGAILTSTLNSWTTANWTPP